MSRLPRVSTVSVLGILAVLVALASAQAQDLTAYDRWSEIKPMYFGSETIVSGEDVLEIVAPERALDSAMVPVRLNSLLGRGDPRRIRSIHLIVEGNPVPLAGRFAFPAAHVVSLETQVRVASYSYVRAVAELSDGQLVRASTFVKAAGGCSAPPMERSATTANRLGHLDLTRQSAQDGNTTTIELQIHHPNYSGLQYDQIMRIYIPAHYVTGIDLEYAGTPLVRAQTDISMSRNPLLRITHRGTPTGAVTASVVDSKDNEFSARWEAGGG